MSAGTTPEGTATEVEAGRWVREMFGRVAPRYDLANHLLSFNIDRYWRARTVKRVSHVLLRPETRALDLCCGTGDLLLALQSRRNSGVVLGSDFCHPMLTAASLKLARSRRPAILFEADALKLPLAAASLDLITVAFGFRNLANYDQGLAEMRRVLRPHGLAAILEFSHPPNRLFRAAYTSYSRYLLPLIGGALSGSRDAYRYLPESVRKFPSPEELSRQMTAVGFTKVTFERMTGGIVTLHLAYAGAAL